MMNEDLTLLMGIILLLLLGAVLGWYLCERWYSKKILIILEECKKLNAATITLWEDILKHKEKNLQNQDHTPK
jgi:hypothetical protein